MLSARLLVIAMFVGSAALASAQTAQDGGINYDTARNERRLTATQAQRADHARREFDEPSWAAAPLATNFVQNDPREGEPATFETEVKLLYDNRAIYIGVFAKDPAPAEIIVNELRKDFNTGNADGFQVVIDTFHDRAQRLSVRDQPDGREVGLADVERGPRSQCELGRHLGCRHAHRRRRVVRRDRDSVQDAEVRPGGDADLGHQLPAPAAQQEREQLLVAAAAHSPVVARVDGRHLRGPAGAEARRERAREAVRARQSQQGRDDGGRQGLRRRLRREIRRDVGTDVGLHGQHRLLAGRSRRAAGQPDALQLVLPGEARLLPRELRRLPIRLGQHRRRWRRQRRAPERLAGHDLFLQPADRPLADRGRHSPARRHAPDRSRRRLVGRRAQHPAAREGPQSVDQLHRAARCAATSSAIPTSA